MQPLSKEELVEVMFKVCRFEKYFKQTDLTDYVVIEIPEDLIPEDLKEILKKRSEVKTSDQS